MRNVATVLSALLFAVTARAEVPKKVLALCLQDAFACEHAAVTTPLKELQSACSAKVPGSCLASAYLEVRLNPLDAVRTRSRAVFTKACDAKQQAGCALAIAVGAERPNVLGHPPEEWSKEDRERSEDEPPLPVLPTRERLDKACLAKEPVACELLGRHLRMQSDEDTYDFSRRFSGEDDSSPENDSPAMQASCAKGSPVACFRIGKTPSVRACAEGVLGACDKLFNAYGDRVEDKDLPAIERTLRGACERGFREACGHEARRVAWLASSERREHLYDEWRERMYRSRGTPGAEPTMPALDSETMCSFAGKAGDALRSEEIEERCKLWNDNRETPPSSELGNLVDAERHCVTSIRYGSADCVRAAQLHLSGGVGITVDKAEAARFGTIACERKVMDGCRLAAEATGNGAKFAEQLVAKGDVDAVARAFLASPELFRNTPGLRPVLDKIFLGSAVGFELLVRAYAEGYGGPPDVPRALAIAGRVASGTAFTGAALAVLERYRKDPQHGAEATRRVCFAVGGAACDGLGLLSRIVEFEPYVAPHYENGPLPSGQAPRPHDLLRAVAVDGGHALVATNRELSVYELATGRRVAGPTRWVPEPTQVLRGFESWDGRRSTVGAAWSVGSLRLFPSPRGPIALATVSRTIDEKREELFAILVPGREARVFPRIEGQTVLVDGAHDEYWLVDPAAKEGATVVRRALADGRDLAPARLLEDPNFVLARDGSLFVSWKHEGGTLRLLEPGTGRVRTFEVEGAKWIRAVAVAEGGRRIAVDAAGVRIFDLAGEKPALVRTLDAYQPHSFDASGNLLLAGNGVVFDVATGEQRSPPFALRPREDERQNSVFAWDGSALVQVGPVAGVAAAEKPAVRPLPAWASKPFALPALPAPVFPESSGSADTELVVLKGDKPVADVEVTAKASPLYEKDGALKAFAARMTPWKGRTDANGRVVAKGLPRGLYIFSVRAKGVTGTAWVDLASVQMAPAKLSLYESRFVGGVVKDRQAKLVANAVVQLVAGDEVVATQKTGADGAWLFDHIERADLVQACLGGVCQAESVDLSYSLALRELVLPDVKDEQTMHLIVKGESGRPAAGLRLFGLRIPDDGRLTFRAPYSWSDASTFVPFPGGPRKHEFKPPFPAETTLVVADASLAVTLPARRGWNVNVLPAFPRIDDGTPRYDQVKELENGGTHTWRWLPAGTYVVQGRNNDGESFVETIALKPSEQLRLAPKLHAPRTLTGRVVDAQGKPVAGAVVELETFYDAQYPRWLDDDERTDERGQFRIEGVSPFARAGSVWGHLKGRRAFLLAPGVDALGDVALPATPADRALKETKDLTLITYGGRRLLAAVVDRAGPLSKLFAPYEGRSTVSYPWVYGDHQHVFLPLVKVNGRPVGLDLSEIQLAALLDLADPAVLTVELQSGPAEIVLPASVWAAPEESR